MMGALAVSQLDSPLPGPSDVAGVGIAAGTLISAGVAWIGYEIYSNYKSHTVNSKKYEKGDKLPTPESEPVRFNKKRGSQGWENTETGEIYQKSQTSHGNKNNEGIQ